MQRATRLASTDLCRSFPILPSGLMNKMRHQEALSAKQIASMQRQTKISTFNRDNTLCEKVAPDCAVKATAIAPTLIRIVAVYESPESKRIITCCGSGFSISHELCVTAAHCIQSYIVESGIAYTLVFIGYQQQRKVSISVYDSVEDLEEDFLPLEILPIMNVKNERTSFHLDDCSRQSLSKIEKLPDVEQAKFWQFGNDVAILKVKHQGQRFHQYARPKIVVPGEEITNVSVFAYPGKMDSNEFSQLYGKHLNYSHDNRQAYYELVCQQFKHFERKTYMQGDSAYERNGIIVQDCPTLPGTAGGLLTVVTKNEKETNPCWSAVHVGGCIVKEQNYSESISDPFFALEYLLQMRKHSRYMFLQEQEQLQRVMDHHKFARSRIFKE